jgi:hypothetical protein
LNLVQSLEKLHPLESLGLGYRRERGHKAASEAPNSYLFSWLANTESARRGKNPDEFSLYLQERKEANQPYYRQGDSDAINIDTWISLFQLDLMFSN